MAKYFAASRLTTITATPRARQVAREWQPVVTRRLHDDTGHRLRLPGEAAVEGADAGSALADPEDSAIRPSLSLATARRDVRPPADVDANCGRCDPPWSSPSGYPYAPIDVS